MKAQFILFVCIIFFVLFTPPSVLYGQGGGGKGGGGHTETAGNNLSFPVIWSDGFALGLRGVFGSPVFNGEYTNIEVMPGIFEDVFYQQDLYNEWQAGSLDWTLNSVDPLYVSEIDWGDNLEARFWPETSRLRTEVVLYQNLATPMLGFEMHHIEGQGKTEMWGACTNTYLSDQANVYSRCARFTIQKLSKDPFDLTDPINLTWIADLGEWIGDVGEPENPDFPNPVFKGGVWEGGDGPGYYSAEINVGGKVIYGYNWVVRELPEPREGFYRLTFSFCDNPEVTNIPLNTYFDANTVIQTAEEGDEEPEGGKAYVDYMNNLTYLDLEILSKGH